jgi:hypothetical protein
LWFCEERATPTQKFEEEEEEDKKFCAFFFSLFRSFSLSPVSPSLFFVSRSLVEKKKEEGAIFCSKARRKYRQNTRSRFTRCISTAILLQKRVFLRD